MNYTYIRHKQEQKINHSIMEKFRKDYIENVIANLNDLPGDRDYSLCVLVADTIDKETGEQRLQFDTELIDPFGDRIKANNTVFTEFGLLDFLINDYAIESKVENHYAFQVTVDHLWRKNRVLETAVYLIKLNYLQLKMIQSIW